MTTIKVGDTVNWRGCFGMDAPKPVKVRGLELTVFAREKYGKRVQEVSLEDVQANRVIFDLDNNHWAYSEQIVL